MRSCLLFLCVFLQAQEPVVKVNGKALKQPIALLGSSELNHMGAKGNAYRILVGKSDGKVSLGRARRRWVDNIKIDV
jgi:hypothetical protein